MVSIINKDIFKEAFILKTKENAELKRLKKIVNNLKRLAVEDVKGFSKLNIKIFEEEKEEEKKPEFKIVAPIIGFHHYFEDFKKTSSKLSLNNIVDCVEENTCSTVDDEKEELNQVDSSDLSDNE